MKKSADIFCALTLLIALFVSNSSFAQMKMGPKKAAFNPGGNSLKKLDKEALKQDFALNQQAKKVGKGCCKVDGIMPHF